VSLVAVVISAGFDLTAGISTLGEGEAVSPGMADIPRRHRQVPAPTEVASNELA
jgi:hypothetical protein